MACGVFCVFMIVSSFGELARCQDMFKNIFSWRVWPAPTLHLMPYAADHKDKTRTRIVDSARVLFNRHGFDSVSIDDVMKGAGLTRGGFYSHFSSKQSLYAAAVSSFNSCNPFARRCERKPKQRTERQLAELLVDTYLSDDTLADVDNHCPLIALPSDVARAGLQPRAAYTQLVEGMLDIFRAAFSKADRRARHKAQLIVNLCVGGMLIARTTDDASLRKQLRAAARSEALRLLAAPHGTPQDMTTDV
jgi:TetR/AcrR family transcriptional regulator, transcriptional repressor for nem operon